MGDNNRDYTLYATRYTLVFAAASLVFFADWLSKFYIKENFFLGKSIPVIKGFFYLTYLKNKGIIFGLLARGGFFVIVLNGLVILCFIVLLRKFSQKNRWFKVSLGLVWGGLVANFFDRVWDGQIIDFLDFHLWPVFNFADVAICVGVGLFIWRITKKGTGYFFAQE